MMSLMPDFRKSRMGMAPSAGEEVTRFKRIRLEFKSWRQRGQCVQVLLRCRPLTDDEQKSNVPKVITCDESKREVTVLESVAGKQVDRVSTFDKVFGLKASTTVYI